MEIIKATGDKNIYKYFKLSNNLECVFINDKKASQSAVSLAVGCGSYDEKIDGLAHFLEHMLFMGNEKYKDETDYFNFISIHNGYSNAYTANDHTNYFYTIDSNYLIESFDIFSQFFISPLFLENSINREINAVNSEHDKNKLDDTWRYMETIKKICNNPALSHFSTGNLETLNIPNIRNNLIDFFNTYYSANIMKLVVLYNGDDENNNSVIENMIKFFSPIKNNNYKKIDNFKDSLLNTNKLIKSVPIKDKDSLSIIFELNLDNSQDIINNNILDFISTLLTSKSTNSLYHYLYNNCHILGMTVDTDTIIDNKSMIIVHFTLTNTANIEVIYNAYNNYINLLINGNFNNILEILEIKNKILEYNFQNHEIEYPDDFVYNLSKNLLQYSYDRKFLLKYEYQIKNFLSDDNFSKYVKNILKSLLLDKNNKFSFLEISNKYENYNNLITENFYQIKYSIEDYNIFDKYNLNTNIHLNFPKFELYNNNNIIYNKIIDDNENDSIPMKLNDSLFIKKTNKFNNTNTMLLINIKNNETNSSIHNYLSYSFYFELLKFIFFTDYENLNNSGYEISVNFNNYGININIYGYYNKINEICEYIFSKLNDFSYYNNKNFAFIKNKLIKSYMNNKFNSPYKKLNNYKNEIYFSNQYSTENLKKILDNINSFEDLEELNLFNCNNLLIYAEGNIKNDNLIEIYNTVNKYMNYSENKNNNLIKFNTNLLLDKNIFEINNENTNETNDCVNYTFFMSNMFNNNNWIEDYILNRIFNNIISNNFFDTLRTKEQLGYITQAYANLVGHNNDIYTTFNFTIQSNIQKKDFLKKRIENYIKSEIPIILNNISSEDLYDIVFSLKEFYLKDYATLNESASVNFDKILNGNYYYNFNKLIACNIKLDYDYKIDLINFYNKYFNLDKFLNICIMSKNI